MKTAGALVAGFLVGVGATLAGTSLLDRDAHVREADLLHQVGEQEAELSELRRRASALDGARKRRRTEDGSETPGPAASGDDPAPASAGEAASEAPETDAVLRAAERRSRVDALRAKTRSWFDAGDGKAALKALKELAALAPEGREAAMALAVEMNEDVNGRGRLKLSMYEFYSGMGDPAVKDLMGWSLGNPSPEDFRVMAAYGLPWTQSADATVEQFAGALAGEQDVRVQRALVANMARLGKESASKALHGLFLDGNRDAQLRAQIATELALSEDEQIVRAIEQAAANDASDRVRSAAKAALVAHDPPASGYLITGTVPQSQGEAAGLAPGDILVSYDGKKTATPAALREAAKASGDRDQVAVVVVRDGQEVTVLCRPGRLGVYGRAVKAAEE